MDLEFRHIAFNYGSNRALDQINLAAPAGKITCLLGSSGCGKTTLLNLAAGLLPLQHGSIHLGGQLLADANVNPPPEKRPMGLVFQANALFPHLTIARNIAFGVDRHADRQTITQVWLERIGLAGFAARYPDSLSGGQQQRVALARAMAAEPAVLLMDEPFASVDIVLRRTLRRECRRLLKERGATAILVTHDPEEAMDIGDRIAVMDGGRIVQADSPGRLYDAPATAAVGALFGDAQIVEAARGEGGLQTPFGLWPLTCLANPDINDPRLDLLVRKSCLQFEQASDGLQVQDVRRNGPREAIELANARAQRLTIEHDGRSGVRLGSHVAVMPAPGSVFAFAKGS